MNLIPFRFHAQTIYINPEKVTAVTPHGVVTNIHLVGGEALVVSEAIDEVIAKLELT